MRRRNWYLKLTTYHRRPPFGTGVYPECGQWTKTIINTEMCQRGWHACPPHRIASYATAFSNRLFVCQLDGELKSDREKVVAERLRLLFEIKRADLDRMNDYLRHYHAEYKPIGWVRSIGDIYDLCRALNYYSAVRRYFQRYISRKVKQWEAEHGER